MLTVPARLVILVVGLAAFAVVHSVLAGVRVRRAGEVRVGGAQRYRLLYTLLTIALLAMVYLATRGAYPIVWRATGVARIVLLVVQGIGVVGFVLTVGSFKLGEFLGLRAPGATSTGGRFRTDGLYALCRHPLYFFTSLILQRLADDGSAGVPVRDLALGIFVRGIDLRGAEAGDGAGRGVRDLSEAHAEVVAVGSARVDSAESSSVPTS